ncbi:MAG TPA: DUF2335 domain-containing protein [Planctomycetaceae bacterium]|nr:DUF2335 domain-containing protein [Planctomycetaceae bacterium]
MSYQGPIPPAHMLEEYEAVVPGSAKQIIEIFVEQARHRMRMEAGVTEGATKRAWSGFSLGVIGLLSGGILVALNHDTAGSLLAGGSLVSLVGVFIFGTNSQRRERLEKQKQAQPKR